MYKSFYGISHNPFDKQLLKEKECFMSEDMKIMVNRLNYLKDVRGIGVFTADRVWESLILLDVLNIH